MLILVVTVAAVRPNPKALSVAALGLLLTFSAFAQQAPAVDLGGAARLLSFTGQISVVRDSRDSSGWALHAGDLVQPLQVVITGPEGWGVFQVADGSKFEVYPNSKVVFRANRGDWKEMLEVWLGKVRVQIEHFGNVPNNNKVRTPSAVIAVRGTIFDVTVEEESESTLVEDEEGSVSVRHLLRPGNEKVLIAGDSIRIYKNEPIGKAQIDKGAIFQKAVRAASDAFYRLAINARQGGTVAGVPSTTTGSPGDKNNTTPPPPPPPPAPTTPPPPPPAGGGQP